METLTLFIVAGLGGIIPYLASVASTVALDSTAMPDPRTFIFLLCSLFAVGSVTSIVLAEQRNLRSMFLAGAMAPSILLGTLAGNTNTKNDHTFQTTAWTQQEQRFYYTQDLNITKSAAVAK